MTVSVRMGDRPLVAVIADMVEGVVVANRLDGPEATRVRTMLWESMTRATDTVGLAARGVHAA